MWKPALWGLLCCGTLGLARADFTKVIAAVAVESGRLNTMTNASIALQVKMSNVLALSAGYSLVRNSNPPLGVGAKATLTTLNLVYELNNPKLVPE